MGYCWTRQIQNNYKNILQRIIRHCFSILYFTQAYSVTDRKTFNNIESWMTQIEQNGPEEIVRVIVGNKIDCPEEER